MAETGARCPFCRIVEGADPAVRIVRRDERTVAFFPTDPATLGHTLLIPRAHRPDIWSLDVPTAEHLARTTLVLAAAIERTFRPDGLNVIQSNGRAATQTVPHLHVHLVPRWAGDPMGRIWPERTNYPESAKDDAAGRLREVLDRS